MEPDTSRHYRKWEPQASPSCSLFQTFLDFLSFPTGQIKTHLSSVPFPKARSIFLVSFCASSDVGLRTSLLVRKHDLHFLCNRKPLCVCRVLLEEAMHASTSWGLEGKEGESRGSHRLALLEFPRQLPSPHQVAWAWWAAVASALRCFLLSVQVGVMLSWSGRGSLA